MTIPLQVKEIPAFPGTGEASLNRLPGEEPDEASDLPPPPGTVMMVNHVDRHSD